ncbi:hypothetical protein NE235_32490 [Actinoallomurus spadix]|uniref:Uncharacterized protein n=1 Tax=Actinoallomurus spadix TaxID=79912 RepID=A0ABN0X1G2_9ACTN|nr:hypothetical protein [Actinoallomurus spadix]MCO5990841.1 hypothetical protein [Actinoallomurus spadix]
MRRITLGILSASAAMCTLTAVQSAALADAPVAHAAQARLDLQPIYFDAFSVSYDPFANVTVNGGLRSDSAIYSALPLTIEYSSDGKTGWTVKKNVTADSGGNAFNATFYYGRSGYWRARFAGDGTYQAATSPVRKAWRWRTEIHKFKVSPKKVRKNHYVTASGSLIRWFSDTRHGGYSGRKVRIIFRFKGKKTWYHLAWAKTNGKGKFSKKVRAYGKGYYAAEFEGGSGTFASESSNTPYVKTYGRTGGSVIAQALPGPVVNRTPALSGPFLAGGSAAARRD